MHKKVSPAISRILYLMSISNLLFMIICIITATFFNINIQFSTIPALALLGTLLDVVLGYFSRVIQQAVLVFGLANCFLSILMWLTARFLCRPELHSLEVKELNFSRAEK
jgi:hypothetical protein